MRPMKEVLWLLERRLCEVGLIIRGEAEERAERVGMEEEEGSSCGWGCGVDFKVWILWGCGRGFWGKGEWIGWAAGDRAL